MDNIPAMIKVSTNRYRENQGLYFEDFEIRTVIEHLPGRTITEADNTWMTLLSLNRHPIHLDQKYAQENSEFGKILVNSTVTFAIINGMTVERLSAKTIANLGWDKVKLVHPVFIGDTLYAESEILSKRESKSRPHQGIIKIRTIGKNQDHVCVISMERVFLIPKKYQ